MKNIIIMCSDELEADGEIWRALLNSCNPLRVRKTETNQTKKRNLSVTQYHPSELNLSWWHTKRFYAQIAEIGQIARCARCSDGDYCRRSLIFATISRDYIYDVASSDCNNLMKKVLPLKKLKIYRQVRPHRSVAKITCDSNWRSSSPQPAIEIAVIQKVSLVDIFFW